MKRRSKKGFTLAELLIVIAIIAILVAVMFPVFGAQLNKARAAADLANVRAKYSELVAEKMLGDGTDLTANLLTGIEIKTTDLAPALQYPGSKVSVSNTNKTVTVEHDKYSGTFTVDSDVKLSGSKQTKS